MSDFGTLSQRQSRFIRAMVTEPTVRGAAAAAHIAPSTAYRWLRQPEVRQALQVAELEALQDITRALLALAAGAEAGLRDILQSATPAVKLRAWDLILSKLLQLRGETEFEQRLVRLEELIMGRGDYGSN